MFAQVTRVMYDIKDDEHEKLGHLRQVVISATLVGFLLVALVCVWGAIEPSQLPLCFEREAQGGDVDAGEGQLTCPSGIVDEPQTWDVAVVAFLGVLGAALSWAVFAGGLPARRTPYAVPLALSLMKLPLGALVAFFGILLIHGGFVPGLSRLDTQPQILVYAVFFGAAQQVVTKVMDKRASDVTDGLPIGAGENATASTRASERAGGDRPAATNGARGTRADGPRRSLTSVATTRGDHRRP